MQLQQLFSMSYKLSKLIEQPQEKRCLTKNSYPDISKLAYIEIESLNYWQ